MTIQKSTSTESVQCGAECDRENRVARANLAVGVDQGERVEDSVVHLPECPTCPLARVSGALPCEHSCEKTPTLKLDVV
jgi:hypothetical protein